MRKTKQHEHNEPAARELDPSERFPFRATCPEDRPIVRERMNEIAIQHHGIVLAAARKMMPSYLDGFDDLMQQLWLRVIGGLPRYDTSKGVKVSTYIGMIAFSHAAAEGSPMINRRRTWREMTQPINERTITRPGDMQTSYLVDAAVRGLLADPARWMTPSQADTLLAVYHDDGEVSDVASRIRKAKSTLYQSLRKIRGRLHSLDLLDLVEDAA